MSFTIEDAKENLLSLDQVLERLEPTEGLASYPFECDGGSKVEFDFPDTWNEYLKDLPDLHVTTATVSIDGVERAMTKAAALEISSLFHIQKEYALALPGSLHTAQMNHWGSNTLKGKARSLKLLGSANTAMGFMTESRAVYSNVQLLEEAMGAVSAKYGENVEMVFDRKFHHDLKRTNIRLIIPAVEYNIHSARALSSGKDDKWYPGIHIANSLVGENPTQLDAYAFAFWCANGSTTSHVLSSRRKRKSNEDGAEVYAWAAEVCAEIVEGVGEEIAEIAKLVGVELKDELIPTLDNIYDHYAVPVVVRQAIQDNMIENDDLSAYGLMQAVTATANGDELSWKQIEDIMRIGGDIPHAMGERCTTCHKF